MQLKLDPARSLFFYQAHALHNRSYFPPKSHHPEQHCNIIVFLRIMIHLATEQALLRKQTEKVQRKARTHTHTRQQHRDEVVCHTTLLRDLSVGQFSWFLCADCWVFSVLEIVMADFYLIN